MKKTKRKHYLLFVIVLFIFALSACSSSPKFEMYKGKALNIAVVGKPPNIREEHVRFKEISFADLKRNELDSYHAIIIMKEYLPVASKSEYADVYLKSSIPFFFISTNSHLPFILKDIEFDKSWDWSAGEGYATGVLTSQNDNLLKYWEFGLYNDKKTDKHIEEMYSRIFKTIEELNL